jgi:hypothetical protein
MSRDAFRSVIERYTLREYFANRISVEQMANTLSTGRSNERDLVATKAALRGSGVSSFHTNTRPGRGSFSEEQTEYFRTQAVEVKVPGADDEAESLTRFTKPQDRLCMKPGHFGSGISTCLSRAKEPRIEPRKRKRVMVIDSDSESECENQPPAAKRRDGRA